MKNNRLKRKNLVSSLIINSILFMFFVFFIYIVSYFILFPEREAGSNSYHQIKNVYSGVLVESSDGTKKRVDLPAKFSSDNTYSYSFYAEKMEKDEHLYLFIMGAYLKFKLMYQNQLIYEYEPTDTGLMDSGGNFIRFIMIPEKYVDKKLHLEFEPMFQSNYGIRIPGVSLGSHSDLMMFHYYEDFSLFIISTFLFVFGVESMLIIILLFFYKKISLRSSTVSLFAFVSGIYVFVRSPMVFMSIPRGVFLNTLEYITFLYIPVFLVGFVLSLFKREEECLWQYKLGKSLALVLLVNLIVQMFLTFTKLSEFMRMQKLIQGFFIFAFIAVYTILFTLKLKEKKDKIFLFFTISVNTVFLSVLVVYMLTSHIQSIFFIGLGCLLFIIFQVYLEVDSYSVKYKEFYVADLYKKLALIDNLTRLSNRNAFERDFSTNINLVGKRIMMMVIDLNNIKLINDRYGHNMGDFIIQGMAESINSALKKYSELSAYRMGGDEFLISAFDVTESFASELKLYIERLAREFSEKKFGVPMSFGVGYGVYDITKEFDIEESLKLVDRNMYEDKKKKKSR